MHLDHKLPWKTIASHFTFAKAASHGNYNLAGLNLSSQTATLRHFSRVMYATIEDFSDTEAHKIDCNEADGKLFSDDVLSFSETHFGLGSHDTNSALNNPLSATHQDLEFWKRRTYTSEYGTHYSTQDGDLADAAKMLVITAAVSDNKSTRHEALSALCRLSAQVPMSDLRKLHWGHGFGLNLVAGVALEMYVLLNLIEAVQSQDAQQVSLLRVDRLLYLLSSHALQDYDYPAQNIPHRAFWNSLGVTDSWASRQRDGMVEGEEPTVDPLAPEDDEIHRNARMDLKRYLKNCFAILYVYNVFLKKVTTKEEREEFWLSEIAGVFLWLGCDLESD